MDREALKAMIASNKQSLALLDKQLAELQQLQAFSAEEDLLASAKEHPFFYAAVGDDKEPGIPLDVYNQAGSTGNEAGDALDHQIFSGLIRLHEDAPFVWTGILTARMIGGRLVSRRHTMYQSIYDSWNSVGALRLGFIDEGSGRTLYQAEENGANAVNGGGELLASSVYDVDRILRPQRIAPAAGDPRNGGCHAPGHGPSSHFQLPSEMLLPASGVVRVNVSVPIFFTRDESRRVDGERAFVGLIGYKIFGD